MCCHLPGRGGEMMCVEGNRFGGELGCVCVGRHEREERAGEGRNRVRPLTTLLSPAESDPPSPETPPRSFEKTLRELPTKRSRD